MSSRVRRIAALGLFFVALALPLGAHFAVAQDATPCPPLTQEEAEAWVQGYYAAWNAHDAAATASFMAPDYVHHWGIGIDVEGVDAFQTSLENFIAAFPGLHATVDRIWVTEDSVVIRWIDIGVQEQEFMGVPPSQETVTWTGLSIFRLECGKAVEGWTEADHFGRIEQQGVIPVATPEA
jgi:steroid delta-isomerase-like uncharacterized protein